MLAFVEKPRATKQTTSGRLATLGQTRGGPNREPNSNLLFRLAMANQASRRTAPAGAAAGETGAGSTKLAISRPGDEHEREADRMAEQVMRGPVAEQVTRSSEPQLRRACACGGTCPKCQTSNPVPETGRLQTKRVGSSATEQRAVPSIVHDVLGSPGQSLDRPAQSLMGQRFGADFSDVRIHTGAAAAESALAVDAHAYTVGKDVVFGANQYQPGTADGRRLLAHELAHVVQQSQAPSVALMRACRSAAQCAAPARGNAGTFGVTVEAESEDIARASGGTLGPNGVTSCLLPRHGTRATNLETLATTAGLGATIDTDIDGYFINACLSPNDGAFNTSCSSFPGGLPAGTNAAHNCVQIHTDDEDEAIRLRAARRPLGDADLRQFLSFTAMITHESQHMRFERSAGTIVPPAADCNVSTAVTVASGRTVGDLLSEISAEIAEFDVYFRNTQSNPSRSSRFAMQSAEHDIATRGGENIRGNIRALQCACSCATVDTFVTQVFNDASSSWSGPEKTEFQRAMTGFIPGVWPRALHVR